MKRRSVGLRLSSLGSGRAMWCVRWEKEMVANAAISDLGCRRAVWL